MRLHYFLQGGYVFTGVCFCLLAGLRKNYTVFAKFGGKVGPRKKLLDFCGNPDHFKLGLVLG